MSEYVSVVSMSYTVHGHRYPELWTHHSFEKFLVDIYRRVLLRLHLQPAVEVLAAEKSQQWELSEPSHSYLFLPLYLKKASR